MTGLRIRDRPILTFMLKRASSTEPNRVQIDGNFTSRSKEDKQQADQRVNNLLGRYRIDQTDSSPIEREADGR